MEVKFILAKEIVARFHNTALAEAAHLAFVNRFAHGALPENIEERTLEIQDSDILFTVALKNTGLVSSTSEALRMMAQGGIKINEQRVTDSKLKIKKGFSEIVQLGKKRIFKISLI